MTAQEAAIALVAAMRADDDGELAAQFTQTYLDEFPRGERATAAATLLGTVSAHFAEVLEHVPNAAEFYAGMILHVAKKSPPA